MGSKVSVRWQLQYEHGTLLYTVGVRLGEQFAMMVVLHCSLCRDKVSPM